MPRTSDPRVVRREGRVVRSPSLQVSLSLWRAPEGDEAISSQCVQKLLRAAGVRQADLSVILLSGRAMRALNRKSLGHDYVTDVITFNLGVTANVILRAKPEGSPRSPLRSALLEGEIYICPAEAKRNARLYGEPYARELLRYIAHGILHLLGHGDDTDAARSRMRREEDRLLAGIKKETAS